MFEISRQYELSVLVNNTPVTEYFHDNNVFVEGREGSDFAIRFSNRSYEDVEVIIALDGTSVLNGKEAGPDGPGFLIKAGTNEVIRGWTASKTEAKSFFFTGRGSGYVAKSSGRTNNVGVIGAMVFRPKQVVRPYHNNFAFGSPAAMPKGGFLRPAGGVLRGLSPRVHVKEMDYSSVEAFYDEAPTGFASASAAPAEVNSLEAGWGSSIKQNLTEVEFERRDAENPDAILAMYYDDRRGLERRGIVLDRNKAYSDPFPGYTSRQIGCEPPKP